MENVRRRMEAREVKVNQNVMSTNLNGWIWKVLLKMCIYIIYDGKVEDHGYGPTREQCMYMYIKCMYVYGIIQHNRFLEVSTHK